MTHIVVDVVFGGETYSYMNYYIFLNADRNLLETGTYLLIFCYQVKN